HFTLSMYANHLKADWTLDGNAAGSQSMDFPQGLNLGQWYRIETQVTAESAPGVHDGAIKVWVNGTLVWQFLNQAFAPPNQTGKLFWETWWVGAQRESALNSGGGDTSDGTAIDETRYWDNVTFSTTRVGPWP